MKLIKPWEKIYPVFFLLFGFALSGEKIIGLNLESIPFSNAVNILIIYLVTAFIFKLGYKVTGLASFIFFILIPIESLLKLPDIALDTHAFSGYFFAWLTFLQILFAKN